ncbi:MAG TPA: D-cysteine desulfhydrase family protein [Candidatus Aminicenantes bacterium]|nr:D-cysteine desulfhydrase family protein [Candidatus Aminicenantes bacterium]
MSHRPTGRGPRDAKALASFKALPRVPLVSPATPVERCERLRAALPGSPEIYIKRDDVQPFLCGGNKLRKLEFVMADARARGATTVLTTGGTRSNHARITAMVARRLGLGCALVLNGEDQPSPRGNFLLDRLIGTEVHFVAGRAEREPRARELAAELERRGERVYVVPLGASDAVGSFGLVAAVEELVRTSACPAGGFDAIVVSSSSGGTQAGLEVGKRLFGFDRTLVVGVSPDNPAAEIKGSVARAMTPMLAALGLDEPGFEDGLTVDDAYAGEAYGVPTEGSREACRLWAETEGILLDPVYTAKASAALFDYVRKGVFKPSQRVLFWHTGGLVNLFDGQEA